MKLLFALGVCAMIGLAGPAHADPGAEQAGAGESAFLASLRSAGITYADPGQAVTAAQAVCGFADRGETGLQIIQDVKANNPGVSTDGATKFVAISAQSFCPHQLVVKAK
jgi:hypothetical protein